MPTEQVTIAYVNPPKPGAKKGSIKTQDGRYFSVWPDKLGGFSKGMSCTIDYDISTTDDGRQFYNLKNAFSALGVPIGGPMAPSANKGGTPGPNTKSEEMFVMGVMGRCHQGTGKLPDAAILAQEAENLLLAWRKAFAPKPVAPPQAAVQAPPPLPDDDIPF